MFQLILVVYVVTFHHIYQLYARYSSCIEAYFIISSSVVILCMEKNYSALLIHATLCFVLPLNFDNSNLGFIWYPLLFGGESDFSLFGEWSWLDSSCGISLLGGILLWWLEFEDGWSSFNPLPTNVVIVSSKCCSSFLNPDSNNTVMYLFTPSISQAIALDFLFDSLW